MAFRHVNFAANVKFNSATSSHFLDFYQNFVTDKLRAEAEEPSSKTFAPSSFRCSRKSWFRLRGVEPDKSRPVDHVLSFKADIGTACHKIIQTNLKEALKSNWISVKDYLADNPIPYQYELEEAEDGLETKIAITDIPVRFACDGIIFWEGKYYLLEIKTSEYASFESLTGPKSMHVDQIKCYATLLGLSGVLVLYQDRQYGELKCYEMTVTEADRQKILAEFEFVQKMVEANLAPPRLPTGDIWCASCEYREKCKEWG